MGVYTGWSVYGVGCTVYTGHGVGCTWGGVYTYDVYMGLYMCGNVTTRHDIPCFNRMDTLVRPL